MIVIGSTIPAYKAADYSAESLSWMVHTSEMFHNARDNGFEIKFFATLELDGRGLEPFYKVLEVLDQADGDHWCFSLQTNEKEITSRNRLKRICMGRNLIQDYAQETGASHILFLDSDTEVPGDSISRLLRLKHPIVGGNVPVYCMKGPLVDGFSYVQKHWNTAGFLLVERQVFRAVRWGIDLDDGRTDDPQYQHIAMSLGFGQTWVDHDLVGTHRPHTPGPLPPMEKRGHDRRIR